MPPVGAIGSTIIPIAWDKATKFVQIMVGVICVIRGVIRKEFCYLRDWKKYFKNGTVIIVRL